MNKFKKLLYELETKLIKGIITQLSNFCNEFESNLQNSKNIEKS